MDGSFDRDLDVCGDCGVPRPRHDQDCAPADLDRVAVLEEPLDRQLDALTTIEWPLPRPRPSHPE